MHKQREHALIDLQSATYHATPTFTFSGVEGWARVVDVYDGDTITVAMQLLDNRLYKLKLRLKGIDTCEIKGGKNQDSKALANAAKECLVQWVTKGCVASPVISSKNVRAALNENIFLVFVQCYEFDKYGRTIADIYVDERMTLSASTMLLEKSLAYPYTGGKKLDDDESVRALTIALQELA